jgi:hypothetical protein
MTGASEHPQPPFAMISINMYDDAMSNTYGTPQDAEDAYYDAIDEKDLEAF